MVRPRRVPRELSCLAVCAGLLTVLTACGGTQDAEAATAARQLLTAAADGDGGGACELLAPATRDELEQSSGTPCAEAVVEQDLGSSGAERVAVEVFDTDAQARAGGATLFLSRFDGRWLVVAAACERVPQEPYDCGIELP